MSAQKIEHKVFSFEVDEIKLNASENRATFKGYASAYGNKDRGGDIVASGAFAQAVKSGKPVVVLADHNATVKSNIGFGFDLAEDKKGLSATTEINLEKDAGRETYAMLQHAKEVGFKVGMSVGYSVNDFEWDDKNRVRTIKSADLWEYSVVIFPMNPKATVTAVKSLLESGNDTEIALLKRGIENHLREAGGFSKAEAMDFVSAGFRTLRDAGEKENEAQAVNAIVALTKKITNQDQ